MCSCGHCQKLGGTPVMWWAGWPADRITWTVVEVTWIETFPGEAKRGFCANCGSRLAAAIDAPLVRMANTSGRAVDAVLGGVARTPPGIRPASLPCPLCSSLLPRLDLAQGTMWNVSSVVVSSTTCPCT
ncbi:GFA family protein [Streptomyces sp. NPDC002004]